MCKDVAPCRRHRAWTELLPSAHPRGRALCFPGRGPGGRGRHAPPEVLPAARARGGAGAGRRPGRCHLALGRGTRRSPRRPRAARRGARGGPRQAEGPSGLGAALPIGHAAPKVLPPRRSGGTAAHRERSEAGRARTPSQWRAADGQGQIGGGGGAHRGAAGEGGCLSRPHGVHADGDAVLRRGGRQGWRAGGFRRLGRGRARIGEPHRVASAPPAKGKLQVLLQH
mmetsp:Transcript_82363/g.254587  ORF Transcript_82363/g.254587 Transcript_82363/m.254587 type:complete len:226 (+) Transcript_82363:35-712(+)